MNDLRKAAEMALEALECAYKGKDRTGQVIDAIVALEKALAHQALDEMAAENQRLGLYDDKPPVKSYCGGKPNYCTPEETPDVDAVNISQEPVDETAKGEHEPFIYIREDTEMPFGGYEHCGQHDPGAFPVYTAPPISDYHEGWEEGFKAAKKEWVGLTDDEIYDYADKFLYQHGSNYGIRSFGKAIEAKLKEKNGG